MAYDGILVVNKPAGWTSHDVVARVRRLLGQKSVGHAGTLDPMATGVLLVCAGQATRVSEYLMDSQKVYRALVRLGATTDTYDADGEIVATSPVPDLDERALRAALAGFIGDIEQVPPAYSAIKQNGVPAYRKARHGEAVTLAARPVTIHSIEVRAWRSPDLTIDVTCGPGTYIRSLAHDLGQRLGCGAHLAGLVRLASGRFGLEDTITLEQLEQAAAQGAIMDVLRPIADALGGLPCVVVSPEQAARLAHGQPIPAEAQPTGTAGFARDAEENVVAILAYVAPTLAGSPDQAGEWWPKKVFASVKGSDQ